MSMHGKTRTRSVGWLTLACALAVLPQLNACSSRGAYATGQNMQRQQCFKIEDVQQRQRCLRDADRSYEDYERESKELKPGS